MIISEHGDKLCQNGTAKSTLDEIVGQLMYRLEYVKLCGYSANGDRTTEYQNGTRLTLDEISSQLNISKRELQRVLRIERNLTDSMKELLDTGGVFLDIPPIKTEKLHYDTEKIL